jgi:hypothetical protein
MNGEVAGSNGMTVNEEASGKSLQTLGRFLGVIQEE